MVEIGTLLEGQFCWFNQQLFEIEIIFANERKVLLSEFLTCNAKVLKFDEMVEFQPIRNDLNI